MAATFDIKEVAKIIGFPLADWPGNCYYVASLCVTKGVINGALRYGHYRGPISPKSQFASSRVLGFCQHGWVQLENGMIFDPTRWVFEKKRPYIFVGPNLGWYDVGGSVVKDMLRGEPPIYEDTGKQETIFKLSDGAINLCRLLLKDDRNAINFSLKQVWYLCTTHPTKFGSFAKEIYDEFVRTKNVGLIPSDYQDLMNI